MNSWLAKRPKVAWALYDWANSAYFTTVITAVFPTFYATYAAAGLEPAQATARFGASWVVFREEQRSPSPAHVPLDVVGEHAQEDVCAHAIGGAVVDRTHLQVDRLERAGPCAIPERQPEATYVEDAQPSGPARLIACSASPAMSVSRTPGRIA